MRPKNAKSQKSQKTFPPGVSNPRTQRARPHKMASGGSAAREKISPDLVQQIFQLKWEEDEKERAAAEAEAAAGMMMDAEEEEDGGGGRGNLNNNNNAAAAAGPRGGKKFSIKDEAVMASAEVLRNFAAEIVHRAAEVAHQDGDDTVDGSHLERVLPQLLLDFAT